MRLVTARMLLLAGASVLCIGCVDEDTIEPKAVAPQWTVATIPENEIREDPPMLAIAKALPTFGGFYFDEKDRIVVALTDVSDLPRAVALIRPYLNAHQPSGGFVAVSVEHSFMELARYRSVLRGSILRMQGVFNLGVDERKNVVNIGIIDAGAEANVKRTLGSLGIPSEVLEFRKGHPPKESHTLIDAQPDNQIQGAWQIVGEDGAGCTLGFPVMYWSNGSWQPAFMTNSHCTLQPHQFDGGAFYQRGRHWGSELKDPSTYRCDIFWACRNSDAVLISAMVPMQFGTIARTATRCGADYGCRDITVDQESPYLQITGASYSFDGELLHKIGATTGWTYGRVDGTCEDWPHGFPTNWVTECNDRVSFDSDDGDSGAPVFFLKPDGTIELRGINWGRAPWPWDDGLISSVYQIKRDLGDYLVYDPGPVAVWIEGPESVKANQTCAWTAWIQAGMKPLQVRWSGALSQTFSGVGGGFNGGGITQITGQISSPGQLTVEVWDYNNRYATSSIHISIDPDAENNCYY